LQHRLAWKNGYLILEHTSDYLRVRSVSVVFEIRPRTVVVRGCRGYREGVVDKKYIYVYFVDELKPFAENVEHAQSTIRDHYEIIYTKTFYDEYYTIILPGTFLIDYIIFTSDVLLLAMSSKRKSFYEKLDSELTIYVV